MSQAEVTMKNSHNSHHSRLTNIIDSIQCLVLYMGLKVLTVPERKKLRTRWGDHVPGLARALADVFDAAPEVFASVGLHARPMREAEERTRQIASSRAVLEELRRQAIDTQLEARSDLYDMVNRGMDALKHLLESPFTDPDLKERIRPVARPALEIAERRSQRIRDALKETRQLLKLDAGRTDEGQSG